MKTVSGNLMLIIYGRYLNQNIAKFTWKLADILNANSTNAIDAMHTVIVKNFRHLNWIRLSYTRDK